MQAVNPNPTSPVARQLVGSLTYDSRARNGILNPKRAPVYGSISKFESLLRVLFIRVPYYIGDLERDPNLENYPYSSTSEYRIRSMLPYTINPKP